jgi:hypothetical protein
MNEHKRREAEQEQEDVEQGHLTVPGPESHKSEETPSPDERVTEDQRVPPP